MKLIAAIHNTGVCKQYFIQSGGIEALCFPIQPVKPQRAASAGAGIGQNPGIVAGAVADQRHGFHPDGGDDELAPLPCGKRLAGFIHDLGYNMVFPQMHAFMRLTANGTGHAHFSGTIVWEKPRT